MLDILPLGRYNVSVYLSTKIDIKDLEIDNESLDNIIINLYQNI